jgi:hypothetical protein
MTPFAPSREPIELPKGELLHFKFILRPFDDAQDFSMSGFTSAGYEK